MKFVLGMLLGLMMAGAASADSIWTYAGNSTSAQGVIFGNPCGCALSGSADFAPDGSLVSWSFTDGTHTETNTNSSGFINGTPKGNFIPPFEEWALLISGADGWTFRSVMYGSHFEETDGVFPNGGGAGFLYVQGNQGTWTLETVGAAEPATGLFVGLGLAVVALMRRRRKKSLDNTVWEKLG